MPRRGGLRRHFLPGTWVIPIYPVSFAHLQPMYAMILATPSRLEEEFVLSSQLDKFNERSAHLYALLDRDPAEAVKQARELDLDLDTDERFNLMGLRAAILVDGGSLIQEQDAIEEGLELFRDLHQDFPSPNVTYNLANGLIAATTLKPNDVDWLEHQESTRAYRVEARRNLWEVTQGEDVEPELRTQAWTNLANLFSKSFRFGEAQDGWLAALKIDPDNGVAAYRAARNLLWLYARGGCSEQTLNEARMLAKIATRNRHRVIQYAGTQAAEEIAAFASNAEDPPPRSLHKDRFIDWVERERLTLAPAVELVDPSMGKLDWLMLPGILERELDSVGTPPPVFAMFNMLKSDFILARDLLWRVVNEGDWPATGRFSDTLDFAVFGPNASALILAHRMALDLLDKIAAAANHYFEIGIEPEKVYFHKIWRCNRSKKTGNRQLNEKVERAIRGGATALYGLVELAGDYGGEKGILHLQKDLRNAGTHRFVVLHDFGDLAHSRQAAEIEHHRWESFEQEALNALRVARSAIQMLVFAISQHEQRLAQQVVGKVGQLFVPDHDWIRAGDHET